MPGRAKHRLSAIWGLKHGDKGKGTSCKFQHDDCGRGWKEQEFRKERKTVNKPNVRIRKNRIGIFNMSGERV